MNGYLLPLTCPRCGGELDAVVSSRVNAATACSAVSKCSECSREWQVLVALRPVAMPSPLRRKVRREERRVVA